MRRPLALAGVLAGVLAAGCGGSGSAPRATLRYDRLPIAFEANAGQAAPNVSFIARGAGYTLLLTRRAPVLTLTRRGGVVQRLRLGMAGSSPAMRLRSSGPRTGSVNYLVGADRSRWRRRIPTYGVTRYVGAYPGIDVAFRGTSRRLEFDFEVAPGADPRRIALAPRGQRRLRIDASGALVLGVRGGQVREQPPRSRQLVDGRVVPVASRFVRRANGTIGIALGAYDHSRPLTIDPVLTYGTYLGGTSFDLGNGVAVDASGAAYVTGTTASSNFPATAGAFQTTFAGNQDAFVTKVAPDGHSFVYSTYLGGNGIDVGNDVAVDSGGAAFVTGSTTSPDLPTTAGAFQTVYGGGTSDGFAARLSPSGAGLTWSSYLGGSATDQGSGIALGPSGSAVVAGLTSSATFPTTAGAAQTTYGGGSSDGFVSEMGPTGSALVWSTLLGGAAADSASRVAVDASGAAYVTGRTQSSGFPVTAGAVQGALRGSMDAFATKVAPTGGSFAWSTLLGGSSTDSGEAIAVDGDGAAYVTGTTASSDFPVTAGAAQTAYGGGANDGYVAKIAPGGGSLGFASLLGGNAGDLGRSIAVDAAHEPFVAGQTASANFPTTADAVQTTYPGGTNTAYLARFSPAGNERTFSTFLGGSAGSAALGLALDGTGAAYLTGSTNSADQPVSAGAAQGASGGSTDAFVAKLMAPAVVAPPTTTTSAVTPPPPTATTPTTTSQGPTIATGPVRITWNRVSVSYDLLNGVGILFNVRTPRGREISADLAGAGHGTLHWNRRVNGRVAPPGHYHLTLTATNKDGDLTTKHLGATLRVLYAHAPVIRDGAARIRYELTEPATVSLAVARPGGARTTVVSTHGERGRNRMAWDLRLHGRRVGGAFKLFVTARARRGPVVRVALPAAR